MLFSYALGVAEKILNYYLQLDAVTSSRLVVLAGKTVMIEFRPTRWAFYFLLTRDGVHLANHYEGQVDVTLQGALVDFLHLSQNSSNAAFLASDMAVTGNLEVAQQFKELFAHLEIDWEEQLSAVTGDIAAHQIGRFLRALCGWARQSTAILGQNLTEYVQEEARWFPPREELQDFFHDIDGLRDDVERLTLKIERLSNT